MTYELLRPLLFMLAPETAHHLGMSVLRSGFALRPMRSMGRMALAVRDPMLEIERFGIRFPNPVGLAAGFDKAGEAFNALGALGFGSVEIGTITAHAQPGNDRPRLFRLPGDQALLNRMGFNNPGAQAVAERLARTPIEPVLGMNIGKSKITPLEDAPADYLKSLELLEPYCRYIAVNVSSPNTPGLRTLQEAEPLRQLLRLLTGRAKTLAQQRGDVRRPILLKIAPDLTEGQLDDIVQVARDAGVSGLIATNTTIARTGLTTLARQVEQMGAGGISGAPLRVRSRQVVARLYQLTNGEIPIIGVGGIFTAQDAWNMMLAGASLVQVYTAFIYGGPAIAASINRGLVRLLRRHGLNSLNDIVGLAHRDRAWCQAHGGVPEGL